MPADIDRDDAAALPPAVQHPHGAPHPGARRRPSAPLADGALWGNRETELERGAATQRGVHTDRSTEHLLRDLTDDRQSRARARAELLGGEIGRASCRERV